MNPKVQELLNTVKQLVTEIEGGENESPDDGMDEGMEDETMSEGEGEGGAEVEIEMKPMQKKMGGGGMPESLRKFTGGR